MKNKTQNVIFSILFVSSLTFFGLYEMITIDSKVSLTENRKLVSFEDLQGTNYLDSTFQNTLELAMADQFVGRYQLVNIKNKIDYIFSKIAFIGKNFDYVLHPLSDSGVMQIGSSRYMIDEPLIYSEESNLRVKEKVEQINSFAARNSGVTVITYLPVANHETSLFDEANEVESAGQKYIKTIEDNIQVPFRKLQFDSFEEIKEYSFSSDHHLNNKGSYRMYKELLEMVGEESTIKYPQYEDCHVGETFYGTYSSRTGYVLNPDLYCTYIYDLPSREVIDEKGSKRDLKTPFDFVDYDLSKEKETYPYYYNISHETIEPLSYYDYNQIDKKNVLLVTDSLTKPIIEVFASSFNKTYRLIPYDYTKKYEKYFNYDQFIKDNDIDVVIFAYGLVNYYYQDEWGDRFMETTITGGK